MDYPGASTCSKTQSVSNAVLYLQGGKVSSGDHGRCYIPSGYHQHQCVLPRPAESTAVDCAPVEKFIEKNRLPHLLFYGPPGTGKTSTILAVARRIYGPGYKKQILEV